MKENAFDKIIERQYQYMKQFISFIKESPEQRYISLLNESPHIIQRVPLQYIATYLGLTPVSLSRIRKRISKKEK
jgi:hypothetical protein